MREHNTAEILRVTNMVKIDLPQKKNTRTKQKWWKEDGRYYKVTDYFNNRKCWVFQMPGMRISKDPYNLRSSQGSIIYQMPNKN